MIDRTKANTLSRYISTQLVGCVQCFKNRIRLVNPISLIDSTLELGNFFDLISDSVFKTLFRLHRKF